MKPNKTQKNIILLILIGGAMIFYFNKCSQPIKEEIKDKQRIHLFGKFVK